MSRKTLAEALLEEINSAHAKDVGLDTEERIFALDHGWDMPLVGSAYHEFREESRSYLSSVDDALRLITDRWPKARIVLDTCNEQTKLPSCGVMTDDEGHAQDGKTLCRAICATYVALRIAEFP